MSDLPAILGGNPVRPQGVPTWPAYDPEIADVIHQLAKTGDWGRYHGPHCSKLEAALGEYFSAQHVLLCSSGTAAIELALRAAGISAGDEVILCAYDFKANFTNILLLEAIPVLVDVEQNSWLMDLDQFQQALTPKTRAVIFSHMHGNLVNIPLVKEFCQQRGIVIIEDLCQAPGAKINGVRCGQFGDLATLSFGGSKLLTSGRGGAVLTNNAIYAQRITLYQQRGNLAYPLSEMQAAVLLPQLSKLDALNQVRYEFIKSLYATLDQYQLFESPHLLEESSYYKAVVYLNNSKNCLSREAIIHAMKHEGLPLDSGFRALHLIHSPRRFISKTKLTRSTELDKKLLIWHHPLFLLGELALQEISYACQKIISHQESLW